MFVFRAKTTPGLDLTCSEARERISNWKTEGEHAPHYVGPIRGQAIRTAVERIFGRQDGAESPRIAAQLIKRIQGHDDLLIEFVAPVFHRERQVERQIGQRSSMSGDSPTHSAAISEAPGDCRLQQRQMVAETTVAATSSRRRPDDPRKRPWRGWPAAASASFAAGQSAITSLRGTEKAVCDVAETRSRRCRSQPADSSVAGTVKSPVPLVVWTSLSKWTVAPATGA